MTRPTGYPVHVIDNEAFTEYLRESGQLTADWSATPLAVVRTDDGLATICTEGVGWMEENGKLTIGIASAFVVEYIDYEPATVLKFISDETVELSQFVRVFGDRLENNFHLWKNKIDGVSQDFVKETV